VCCDWTFNALPQFFNCLHEPQEINFAAGNSCRREIQNMSSVAHFPKVLLLLGLADSHDVLTLPAVLGNLGRLL
jgi:hypothetical protein